MTLLIFYVAVAIGISFLCPLLEAALLSTTPTHTAWPMPGSGGRWGMRLDPNLDRAMNPTESRAILLLAPRRTCMRTHRMRD